MTSSSLRLREAIVSSALSTCSSEGSAFSRSTAIPAKSGIGISGRISSSTLNSRSALGGEIHQLDLRLQRRAEAAVGDDLVGRLVDRLLQHFAHHGLAVALLDHLGRHLAGAEPGHAEVAAQLGQPLLRSAAMSPAGTTTV